jgi:hypothetical protein
MTALEQARKLLQDATSRLEFNSPTEERYRLALAWLELAHAHHSHGVPEPSPALPESSKSTKQK